MVCASTGGFSFRMETHPSPFPFQRRFSVIKRFLSSGCSGKGGRGGNFYTPAQRGFRLFGAFPPIFEVPLRVGGWFVSWPDGKSLRVSEFCAFSFCDGGKSTEFAPIVDGVRRCEIKSYSQRRVWLFFAIYLTDSVLYHVMGSRKRSRACRKIS